ncbi:MAG: RHS repeat-associated core domain-containing protein, partial [Phycisphaerae bacterium]|nr:RHS repeat-associated core domain-containing protein [Phycisphaerae bacterium]
VLVLDGPNRTITHKYTWGLDLSGLAGQGAAGFSPRGPSDGATAGIHGAGGIGGLLAVEAPQAVGDPLRHWYFYDGNGNVGQLLAYDATGPTVNAAPAAKYEYDPYGQLIAHTDTVGNPFRFSTKWLDTTPGLGYWGYRHYSPRLGRWMSRDPIGDATPGDGEDYSDSDFSAGVSLGCGLHTTCGALHSDDNNRSSADRRSPPVRYDVDSEPNLYEYARSSPLTTIDPLGLRSCDQDDITVCKARCRFYNEEYSGCYLTRFLRRLKCKCREHCELTNGARMNCRCRDGSWKWECYYRCKTKFVEKHMCGGCDDPLVGKEKIH